MNKENIKLWIEALRSGQYKQTQNALRDGDFYCCLGVACEIYRKQIGKVRWVLKGYHYEMRDFEGTLPPFVTEWLGFDLNGVMKNFSNNGFIFTEKQIFETTGKNYRFSERDFRDSLINLSMLNDQGFTFEEIANLIEYRLNND